MLLLPDFQRLFPQQRLLPDESLDVSRIALIFTDLAGSTALYARRGDPRAYHLVRLHFDTLFTVVNACGGTVVKTIGDAVMAVFQTPAEAMEAAIMMQHAIAELNNERQLSDDERLILKVGVHSGPTLSVTLNDRPDYFGTTVNLAARAQGLSQGRDVVFTEALYHDSEIASNLADWPVISNRAMLKGIENETTIFRLLLDGTAPLPSNHAPALQSEA
jgi:class 3 adenylate cyclase